MSPSNFLKPLFAAACLTLGSQTSATAETAVFAGGCFWCVESNFESVPGVSEVISGFTGGTLDNPTYEDVVTETTGHYEAVEITFDPAQVTYAKLVELFLRSTDVTDAGGQFCDRGESYRSAIFATAVQEAAAQAELDKAAADLTKTIVTPVLPAAKFYPADEYHQDYYKSSDIILTRFGPRQKSVAYGKYRKACGRDARVEALWGDKAEFLH